MLAFHDSRSQPHPVYTLHNHTAIATADRGTQPSNCDISREVTSIAFQPSKPIPQPNGIGGDGFESPPPLFTSNLKMASTKELQLGWIGLGSMGLAMAINIQKHLQRNNLPALHYTNRTLSRGDPLKEIGGIPFQSIRELVQASDVVFISVRSCPCLLALAECVALTQM